MAAEKTAVVCIALGLLGGMVRLALQEDASPQVAPVARDICSRAAASEVDGRLLEQVRSGFGCPARRS